MRKLHEDRKALKRLKRGGVHHQKVDHSVGPIDEEKAPKIGACIRAPNFSNVVAAES
jgi:hypothetical protein